jgi:hypothetical protein
MEEVYNRYNRIVLNITSFLRASERNRIIALVRKCYAAVLSKLLLVDWFFSSRKTQITQREIQVSNSKIFVFVHYSKSSLIDVYDRNVLLALRQLGFFIILVTNSLGDSNNLADVVLKKGRFGRDFSNLRDVVRNIVTDEISELEFFYLNNSMIWKSNTFPALVDLLRQFPLNEIIVPTISLNPRFHAQPFFVYCRLDRLHQTLFQSSFNWIRNLHFKRSVVLFSEVKFYKKLRYLGWNISPVADYWDLLKIENDLRAQNGEDVLSGDCALYNPTQHFWRCLPSVSIHAVKRSLAESNPVNVKNGPKDFKDAISFLESKG